ncbi:MAG: DUF4126 domain-containing protein [Jiangellaceae bacterium]|nr:DUF4126 domain-containing protein [Jiangellaceae bacterium]
MESIAYAISGGWASGISAYATVLILGLVGRAGLADTPEALQRTDVLILVSVLTAVEFVADKIAFVDSLWDSVHTVVRPVVAGVLGMLLAGDASTLEQALTATLAGGVALLSHAAKAGLRLAVNTSPEPASNVGVSAVEDVSVAGVLLLATNHPWLAAGVALVLLAVGLGLAVWLLGRIRRGWRRLRDRYFADVSQ